MIWAKRKQFNVADLTKLEPEKGVQWELEKGFCLVFQVFSKMIWRWYIVSESERKGIEKGREIISKAWVYCMKPERE